jgi:hypothetical protein
MAKIYQKTIASGTDKCLILDPREALLYPFNIGTWTEARLGFLISVTSAASDNSADAQSISSVIMDSAANHFAFGIKDSSETLPRLAGSQFWGASSIINGTTLSTSGNPYTGANLGVIATNGASVSVPSATMGASNYLLAQGGGTTLFCQLLALKMQITDLGGATQSVSISGANPSTAQSVPSIVNMRALLAGTSFSSGTSAITNLAWHDNGVPRPIPNTIFARMPFGNGRLRIHAIVIEKYA